MAPKLAPALERAQLETQIAQEEVALAQFNEASEQAITSIQKAQKKKQWEFGVRIAHLKLQKAKAEVKAAEAASQTTDEMNLILEALKGSMPDELKQALKPVPAPKQRTTTLKSTTVHTRRKSKLWALTEKTSLLRQVTIEYINQGKPFTIMQALAYIWPKVSHVKNDRADVRRQINNTCNRMIAHGLMKRENPPDGAALYSLVGEALKL